MDSQPKHQTAYGQLFVVATPIGNLADITFRAIETLKSVQLIAAEDTRASRRLLDHYGIDTPMISLHEHNEAARVETLLDRLKAGNDIALISDAGTPLISDPGYRLAVRLRREQIRITPIPGPSSITAALSAAGLPTDHFRFAGFLPRSGGSRSQALARIAAADETVVLLESPHRLLATLRDLQSLVAAEREMVVGRELTKLYEEFRAGTATKLIDHFDRHPARGEIVLMVGPAKDEAAEISDQQILDCLASESMQSLPPSARAKAVAAMLGIPKARAYALLIGDSKQEP